MRSPVFKQRGHRLGAAALCLAVAATSAPVVAQDEWTELVRRIIQEAGRVYEERGYSLTHEIYTGALNQGASDTVSIELAIGKSYQILGSCDQDCSDLDFVLYGPGGEEIDRDFEPDDVPIVSVTAPRTGTYQVRATMITCTRGPCRFGIGTFGR